MLRNNGTPLLLRAAFAAALLALGTYARATGHAANDVYALDSARHLGGEVVGMDNTDVDILEPVMSLPGTAAQPNTSARAVDVDASPGRVARPRRMSRQKNGFNPLQRRGRAPNLYTARARRTNDGGTQSYGGGGVCASGCDQSCDLCAGSELNANPGSCGKPLATRLRSRKAKETTATSDHCGH